MEFKMTEEEFVQQISKLENEIKALHDSKSWKITKPLRVFGKIIKTILKIILPRKIVKGLRILWREGLFAFISKLKAKVFNKNGNNNDSVTSYLYDSGKTISDNQIAASLNFCKEELVLPIESIKSAISNKRIKIVSFDIFDTLLTRPTDNPKDIFFILGKIAEKRGIKNFFEIRAEAEAKLGNENANLDDIYDFIEKSEIISQAELSFLKNEELKIESSLLCPRKEIFELYKYATELGKKIVATSDMYLPGELLKETLACNGYEKISAVYVSNEYKSRKSDGKLYEILLKEENVLSEEVCHIGDNLMSDYYFAQKVGIAAFWIPNSFDLFFNKSKASQKYFLSKNVSTKLIQCFTITNFAQKYHSANHENSIVNDIQEFVELELAPFVLAVALSIYNNEKVQSSYNEVFFASRDGYLPNLVYEILNKNSAKLDSKYIYAGRRAYGILKINNFIDYVFQNISEEISFGDVLSMKFPDKNFLDSVDIPDEIKSLNITKYRKDRHEAIVFLKKHHAEFHTEFENMRNSTSQYYKSLAGKKKRTRKIVFDCGYSGSVSENLSAAFGLPVDKIYLYETAENKVKDKKDGTKTITLLKDSEIPLLGVNLIYEELFSPLEGGCIAFKDGKPIFENVEFSNEMCEIFSFIKNCVSDYTEIFFSVFKDYLWLFNSLDFGTLQNNFIEAIRENDNSKFFKEIIFPDSVMYKENYSLTKKICDVFPFANVFEGTGFSNENLRAPAVLPKMNSPHKIGIHLHLFNEFLAQEFLNYFLCFPVPFDLYVTVPTEKIARIVENSFFSLYAVNCRNLKVIVFPNRGRDVAPWILGMRPYQDKYELFCHIQSKMSFHFGVEFGNNWRQHLVKNLIQKDSVVKILSLFEENTDLGCVFPKIFSPLEKFERDNGIRLEGMFNEIVVINSLLERMNIKKSFERPDLFFSQGTMYWYRPKAFEQMFSFPLEVEEFPLEPIGVGGTIAHAFERIPAFVCEINGYKARIFSDFE